MKDPNKHQTNRLIPRMLQDVTSKEIFLLQYPQFPEMICPSLRNILHQDKTANYAICVTLEVLSYAVTLQIICVTLQLF